MSLSAQDRVFTLRPAYLVGKQNGLFLAAPMHVVGMLGVVADDGHILSNVELFESHWVPFQSILHWLVELQKGNFVLSFFT